MDDHYGRRKRPAADVYPKVDDFCGHVALEKETGGKKTHPEFSNFLNWERTRCCWYYDNIDDSEPTFAMVTIMSGRFFGIWNVVNVCGADLADTLLGIVVHPMLSSSSCHSSWSASRFCWISSSGNTTYWYSCADSLPSWFMLWFVAFEICSDLPKYSKTCCLRLGRVDSLCFGRVHILVQVTCPSYRWNPGGSDTVTVLMFECVTISAA